MGLVFYPRGGSAQVVRYLSSALRELGHEVHLLVGTLRDGNPEHDARAFYAGLDLTEVDYTPAWRGFRDGRDPISTEWEVPLHPSYEDKSGVPDRVFYRVDERSLDHLVDGWRAALASTASFAPEVLHLHHLNHLHMAASDLNVPRAAHLHGTELKMLEAMEGLVANPDIPREVALWRRRLADAASGIDHYFAISPDVRDRGIRLLGIDEERISTIPNGVDVGVFRPLDFSIDDRMDLLRRILVDEPRGWREGGEPGSIRYSPEDLRAFHRDDGGLQPLVMFVGRFLAFKRVPLLLEAVRRVNDRFAESNGRPPYNVLVWGGMPGEWEGEHPHSASIRLGLDNVFFCGWLPHDVLARGLNLADLLVAPSHFEPFGQVFLEAMAVGVPCIATRSGGPESFIVSEGDHANGWFAEVDDVDSLASVLFEAVHDSEERRRRGRRAREMVLREYGWPVIAGRFVDVYRRMTGEWAADP